MENKGNILIVDDMNTIINILTRILTKHGYKVIPCKDGEEALKTLEKGDIPDVIISDIMMPKMSGYELCRRVKTHPEWKYIYFIMLTAKDSTEDMVSGFKIGADDYITKPFQEKDLIARLEAGLRIRYFQKELCEEIKHRSLKTVIEGISHHFNNIITGIRGFLELAISKNSRIMLEEAIRVALYNLDRACVIIENLRYFSAKEYLHRIEQINLALLLHETIAKVEDNLRARSIIVQKEIQEVPKVGIDPVAMEQVFLNIISNSVQAIEVGGTIKIKLWKEDSDIIITFQDDGGGIIPEVLPFIFDPFFTTKGPRKSTKDPGKGLSNTDIPGQGLGLAVCKGIIEAHGGTIKAENVHKGAKITIKLPYKEDKIG